MLSIILEDMKFYAGHGVYPQENTLKNIFLADLTVDIEAPNKVEHLSQSIDYEALYQIVSKEMSTTVSLLETIALSCVDKIKTTFPQVKRIEIKISKLNPPMSGEVERSAVRIIKEYN